MSAQSMTAALNETVVTLRGNGAWDFDLYASADDPELLCFGCFESVSFPLVPALQISDRDAIWLVWSGRTFDKPIFLPNR